MSKTFRPWKIDEPLLLPAMVGDFVAADHLARFVLSVVRDEVDLAKITGTYGSERGQPPRRLRPKPSSKNRPRRPRSGRPRDDRKAEGKPPRPPSRRTPKPRRTSPIRRAGS
jgi:hypothetical protein